MSHEGSHTLDRLIYMANQIGGFFNTQGHDKAVAGVADHIQKFWNSRMLNQIFAYVGEGGEGLNPNVKEALQQLEQRRQAQAAQQQ